MIYLTGGSYSCLGGSFWGGRGKGEENERRTGRRKGREHASWLAAKKSLAQRRNKSHSFWGLLFCSLERGLILLLQSLVLSSKDKAPVLCFTTCKPFSFCCLRDTRAQPLSPGVHSLYVLWHITTSGMPATTASHFGKAWLCRAKNQPFTIAVKRKQSLTCWVKRKSNLLIICKLSSGFAAIVTLI